MEESVGISSSFKGMECPSLDTWLWLKEQEEEEEEEEEAEAEEEEEEEEGWTREVCSTSTFVVMKGLDAYYIQHRPDE